MEGLGNKYYATAVKSMLQNFHNFFYISYDPGGFISVDKTPLGLWFQALSAAIFGFQGWSLILPQAIAGAISVMVLYHLVRRNFGKAAGLVSALVLAITLIFVAASRTNNLDTMLVSVLLFASWVVMVATEKASLKWLVISMALVGIGFNIKMLQAYMVLPAFYLLYLAGTSIKLSKKLAHLGVATLVLLGISLWGVVVEKVLVLIPEIRDY
jgi:4-amino-4-deoxy-L-arabinose transferase-like glycosyltransferase